MAETQNNHISITMENLASFGFSCFYYEDEIPPEEILVREVVLAVGGKMGDLRRKFRIPSSLVIHLSRHLKIANNPSFNIHKDGAALNVIKLLSERAGWNQTVADLKLMIDHGPENVFLATFTYENQRIPLGSGVSLSVNDNMSWIGMILVHTELRRQGVARSMMQACLSHAIHVQQKSIIGLDATPDGKQVYEALGFKDSFIIHRSVIPTHFTKNHSSTRQSAPFELDFIVSYLKKKDYTERIQIIEMLENLPEAKNNMILRNGEVKGFAMSRPGRLKPFIGPLIADNPVTAKLLLMDLLHYWSIAGHEEVLMDIPDVHLDTGDIFMKMQESANADLQQIPVQPVRSFMRMYQLISANEADDFHLDHAIRERVIQGYQISLDFMNKEKSEIVPMMFGTAGPEWS